MLLRDVANLRGFFGRFAPELLRDRSTAPRSGRCTSAACCSPTRRSPAASRASAAPVDVAGVLREIDDARAEEKARLLRMQTAS